MSHLAMVNYCNLISMQSTANSNEFIWSFKLYLEYERPESVRIGVFCLVLVSSIRVQSMSNLDGQLLEFD